MPRVVQSPGPGEDLEEKEPRFCHLGQGSPSGRCPPLGAGSRHPPPAASGRSSPGVLGVGAANQGEGGGSREQRTYLVQAQVSVASPGAVPRPLARCSAPPGAAGARDRRRLSRFLREATVNPHYCSSIAVLRSVATVLGAGSRRGQVPNLATTAPADDRCPEGASARGRTWLRECVYACVSVQESVPVCASRRDELSPRGTRR